MTIEEAIIHFSYGSQSKFFFFLFCSLLFGFLFFCYMNCDRCMPKKPKLKYVFVKNDLSEIFVLKLLYCCWGYVDGFLVVALLPLPFTANMQVFLSVGVCVCISFKTCVHMQIGVFLSTYLCDPSLSVTCVRYELAIFEK